MSFKNLIPKMAIGALVLFFAGVARGAVRGVPHATRRRVPVQRHVSAEHV